MTEPDQPDVEGLLRSLTPQVLGVLVRRFGTFDACEDALQEALLTAAVHWARDGVPEQPRGWLLQTATRKFMDLTRSEQARRRREERAAREPAPGAVSAHDETLVLLFLCCHPVLTPGSRGLHGHRRPAPAPGRAVGRGHPADQGAAPDPAG